jgi:hypothetical protein
MNGIQTHNFSDNRHLSPDRVKVKTLNIGICFFSTKHTLLRRKSKGWLSRTHDNVSDLGSVLITFLLILIHISGNLECARAYK